MESRTDKLLRGRSYPLKPSGFASAVAAAGLALPVKLTRWDRYDPGFQAGFYPDGEWLGKAGDFFWVTCIAVPSHKAAALRQVLEGEAIPRFIDWAKAIEALDAQSPVRREKQTFTYQYPEFDD